MSQERIEPPPWLPGVVTAMLPNFACRTQRERAVLHRLIHHDRMRRVWKFMAGLKPLSMSSEEAMVAMFGLAYFTAVERRSVGLAGERKQRIKEVGWGRHFTSAASLDDDVLVSHKPDDPVAKRFQLTLSGWFKHTCGTEHLGLVRTITEVALDCKTTRMAGRLPRKRPKPTPVRVAGLR